MRLNIACAVAGATTAGVVLVFFGLRAWHHFRLEVT